MGLEYAQGGTIQHLIKQKRKLSDEELALIAKSIFKGLKHLHNNDYVHRDLKPSNIVLSDPNDFESIKIVDYGLAVKYQTS